MIEGPELNNDLSRHVVIHADDLAWQTTAFEGIFKKPFELINDPGKARESCLYKFDPGSSIGVQELDERTEVMVVWGRFSDGTSNHTKHTYIRYPVGTTGKFFSLIGPLLEGRSKGRFYPELQPVVAAELRVGRRGGRQRRRPLQGASPDRAQERLAVGAYSRGD